MEKEYIQEIVRTQRVHFETGATLPVSRRIHMLERLYDWIMAHEAEIAGALKQDLGKSGFESYMCETGMVLSEISYMKAHVRRLARERTVPTPLAQFHSRSFIKPSPYGVVLIMSPWNYPFLLTAEPLTDALAAGNTAVLKPSAYSPHTGALLERMAGDCFDPRDVAVITGGRAENQYLLNEHFDYIFFTGSQTVGKEVMRRAAEHLTPVTLELGGKSPCIVDKTADLKLAARRIVFGKYLNCGQTCVAPDYIYCDRAVRDKLVALIKKQIRKQFGADPLANKNYGHIINEKHFDRILGLMEQGKTVYGGRSRRETLQIEPTVLQDVSFSDAIMQEEIFGPLLPVLTFGSLDEAIKTINAGQHPLALYLFTSDKKMQEKVLSRCGFGGGCVNDTVIHLASSQLPFGGFGESGMGSYHGKRGFETFSHEKSIVDKKTWLDLPLRYQPYRKLYDLAVHRFLK